MPRKKKSTAEAAPNPGTIDLVTALKFILPAAKPDGEPLHTHCSLGFGIASIFNGLYGFGIKINSDLTAEPHLHMLVAALSKCVGEVQITQLDNDKLAITAKGFKAFVPCLPPATLAPVAPDLPILALSPAVRTALERVSPLATETAARIVEASVRLSSGSAMATDGHLLMEAWHGVDMPEMILPKAAITKLLDIKGRDITGLGVKFNELNRAVSATFWFGNEAFFKTQLYIDPWPDVNRITGQQINGLKKLPSNLANAIENVDAFTNEAGDIFFDTQSIRTQLDAVDGAVCDVAGDLPPGKCYGADYLTMLLPYADKVDWQCGQDKNVAIFHGDNFRAFLMERKPNAV